MEVVNPIITAVVKALMDPIKKHLGFLVSSTKHVKKKDSKVTQLNVTARGVQTILENAVVNTEVIPESVNPWLEDVQNLNGRSNLVKPVGCFNVARRYKAGKQSYYILEEIEDLENRISKIMFTHAQIPLAEVGSTSAGPSTSAPVPMGTQNNFESRDLIFNDALQALQSNDESQKMIALCGMGGVGKTTMMEQLKKEVEASNMFDWVVKVVIGERPNTISLQQAIAQYIGKDLNETEKDARARRLQEIFVAKSQQTQQKNLVIMDDLWNEVDLADVGLSPLPNGFKLLFTSRSEKVCTQMGVDSIFNIKVLNKTEAKTLFFDTVRPSPLDGDYAKLQGIGENIVMKCGGLPIAIVTIAKSLRGNIKEAWEKALWRLKKDDLKDLERITHRIFEMSYENLKEDEDKAIFLLCGLFPDDFDIRIEDLLRYGWGLNFFKDVKTLAIARGHMKIYVNNLIRANLLTESDVNGCVKMHDLVRAFVLSNFSKVKQASIVNRNDMSQRLTKDANDPYERILLNCTDMCEFPTDFNYPDLSLLIVMDGNKLMFPEDIYERMKKVKVMSFEKLSIPLLPVMFDHSTELRTLCLSSCSLINKDISFLGSLCNLEILSFVDCKLKRLPSTIGKLENLKLLEFTKCGDELCIDDGVFQNLANLEELYMRSSTLRSGNLHELEKLSQGLFALELDFLKNKVLPKDVSFKSLERFKISIGTSIGYYLDRPLENTLDLDADLNELLECKISELFEKVEKLWLNVRGMDHLQDVSLHQKFSNLRDLHVSNCPDLTYLFTVDVASSLKKLGRLSIFTCYKLTSLVGEDSGTEVIEFPEMVELMLNDLPNLTSIFPDCNNNDMSETKPLLNEKVLIPKLEQLSIYSMKNLKQIWPCRISTTEKNSVCMLRMIIVEDCDSLVNLFPCNPLPLLNHLEELYVRDCGSIEVLFNIDFESVSVSGMGEHNSSSSRLRSIKVTSLRKLKELWRMSGVNKSGILINGGFKGVETIQIENCWRFTNIFTPATTNFKVRSLCIEYNAGGDDMAHLTENCEEIIVTYPSYLDSYDLQRLELRNDARVKGVLFEMDSPLFLYGLPTIQVLELNELYISHVWKCNWNQFVIPQQYPFQNLTNISLRDCHKIKYLFSPLMVKLLSNLKDIYLDDCSGIEEVISNRDDENEENITSTSSHQNTTLFPCLDTLKLESLDGLKRIDGGQFQSAQVIDACWSLCQYPKHILIDNCNELSSLVPWYAVGQMKRLEELKITMIESDRLFSNLKSVSINDCDRLQHIFTFSTLESLKQLKELRVMKCKAIRVIVIEDVTQSKGVVFPCLETLVLKHLPDLEGFFLGMNESHWPSLTNVVISNCPQMTVFTSGQSKTPKLKYIHTRLGKHSLESCDLNSCGTIIDQHQITFPTSSDLTISKEVPWKSFQNLITISMSREYVVTIIPSHALAQLQKLQKIGLFYVHKVKEVFEVVALEGSDFNESQTVVKIPNLTHVQLEWLNDLKYLWKSNRWIVLEFPNLTTVSINGCDSLEHVFTCSMVASLVQLQDLSISSCWNIEVIVKEEEECDGKVYEKVNEITLRSLKSLTLSKLDKLKGFCIGKDAFSFPALDTLVIKECRAMTVFTNGDLSTPVLKVLKTDSEMCAVRGDLNSVIETKQREDASSSEDDASSNEDDPSNNDDDASNNEDDASNPSSNEGDTSNNDDDASSNEGDTSNNDDDASNNEDDASNNDDDASNNEDDAPNPSSNEGDTSNNEDDASNNEDDAPIIEDDASNNDDDASSNEDEGTGDH